jgi:hypothetical protein
MSKFARFFAALKAAEQQIKQKIDRHDLIHDFTKGRTQSLTDLSMGELNELITQLGAQKDDPCDRMRKKIISMLKYQGYQLPSGKADMVRIYAFILKYGYLHKHLNEYSEEDLPKLVYQAETMKKKYIANL